MHDENEEYGCLSPTTFIKLMREEIEKITRQIIKGLEINEYHKMCGRVQEAERILKLFINKKTGDK